MFSAVLMLALSNGAEVPACHRRHGCDGCYGGYGCSGCYGSYGCYGYRGCYGGYGGGGCYGGCYGGGYGGCYGGGYAAPPRGPAQTPRAPTPPAPAPPAPKKPEQESESEARAIAPVTLMVRLPADAKLFIDDQPTTSTSATRIFVSPPLPGNREYFYTLSAEAVRNGQTLRQTRIVPVRAGTTANVVVLEFPPQVARGPS
jgi:uncharacterized protein (TIGR03000 family)